MKKQTNKKIITLTILLTLTVTIIFPTLNAETKTTDNVYDLLIITPEKFTENLQPLKEHKEDYNIKTKIVTLEQAYERTCWEGRDKPEKIKYFIKKAYETWGIKYVMLIGSHNLLPVRYVHNQDIRGGYYEPYYISELYYADLYDSEGNFSTWDLDNDAIFGEWKDDNVSTEAEDKNIDLRPDVYLGRLACRNNYEVKIMVNKIITYETQTYCTDWSKRFVVVAGTPTLRVNTLLTPLHMKAKKTHYMQLKTCQNITL